MDRTGVEDRMAGQAGMRPWWPLVEATLPGAFLLTYYVPIADVRSDALVDENLDEAGTVTWTVHVGGRRVERAAWMHSRPLAELAALADHLTFSWEDLDWYEEDEQLLAHARDPHKRVDVLQSSRHVQVEIEGHLVADSTRPSLAL